tara:strand:+ start:2821 stop:2967 length:147 start_codon:yes stop_codon:yes gene_type:complete
MFLAARFGEIDLLLALGKAGALVVRHFADAVGAGHTGIVGGVLHIGFR